MTGVSPEQIKQAKSVDLLSYLQASEPAELRKSGPNEYRTVSHGSLVISKGLWIWNKEHIGGRSALDYLIKVCGMGFVEAVKTVLGSPACFAAYSDVSHNGYGGHHSRASPSGFPSSSLSVNNQRLPPQSQKSNPLKKLYLPITVSVPINAVKYLQKCGIHFDVINQCLKSGAFYEGVYKNPREPELDGSPVCVFIGRDKNGTTRFAAMRGINKDFKRDAAGSDKRFNFSLPADDSGSRSLAVFEAPVDLLSHASLALRGDVAFTGHRLSLGGTSDTALLAYLERFPEINQISLCLDNDPAGQSAVKKLTEALSGEQYRHISVTVAPPAEDKDYNDTLLHVLKLEREQKRDTLQRDRVPSL